MKQAENFREYLNHALELRVQRNSSYSLRAFARDLKVGHARLSEVLSGKKGLSTESAYKISQELSMNRFDREIFLDLVERECSRNVRVRERAQTRIEEREKNSKQQSILSMDAFKLISDWYHFAILALMEFPTYQEDSGWIATQLDITPFQADEAMKRMRRLGLIEMREGRSYPVEQSVRAPDGVSSEAIRKAHHQLLQKAIDALVLVPMHERDFFSYIFPVQSKDLNEMAQKLRVFFQQMFDEYSKRPGLDRVISLSSQMVPLTQIKEKL